MLKFKLVLFCLLSSLIANNASAAEEVTGSNDPVLYMFCFDGESTGVQAELMEERAHAWRALNPDTPILCIHKSSSFRDEPPKDNIKYEHFNSMIATAQLIFCVQLCEKNLDCRGPAYVKLFALIFGAAFSDEQKKVDGYFRCDAERTVLAFWHMSSFPNRGMMCVDLSIQAVAIAPLFTKYCEDLDRCGIVFASGFKNDTSHIFYKENAKEIEKKRIKEEYAVRRLTAHTDDSPEEEDNNVLKAALLSVERAFTADEDSDLRAYLKKLRFMNVNATFAENSAFIVKPENKIFQNVFLKTLDLILLEMSHFDSSAPQFPFTDPQRFYNLLTTSLSFEILKQCNCFLDIDENNPNVAIIPLTLASLKQANCFNGLGESVAIDQDASEQQVLGQLKAELRETFLRYKAMFKQDMFSAVFPIMSENLLTRPSKFSKAQSDPVQILVNKTSND